MRESHDPLRELRESTVHNDLYYALAMVICAYLQVSLGEPRMAIPTLVIMAIMLGASALLRRVPRPERERARSGSHGGFTSASET
jgi:hypothetical protein